MLWITTFHIEETDNANIRKHVKLRALYRKWMLHGENPTPIPVSLIVSQCFSMKLHSKRNKKKHSNIKIKKQKHYRYEYEDLVCYKSSYNRFISAIKPK